MERDVKYTSDKKPVLCSDQKEEGRLLRTKDSFEKTKFSDFLLTYIIPSPMWKHFSKMKQSISSLKKMQERAVLHQSRFVL